MQPTRPIKLLLIDDHSLFRESLVRLLRTEPDFHVAGDYGSASESLAALDRIAADVILLDHDLGHDTTRGFAEQNGLSLLDAIRRSRFTGRILFVTAGMSDDETRAAFERGASGIFLKHSSPADLLTAIRRVAAGERWLDPRAVQSLASAPAPARATHETPAFTAREQSVLDEIFSGLTNKEIAVKLNISEGYVKAVLQQLFAKTGVRTRSQLVRIALEAQFARRSGA